MKRKVHVIDRIPCVFRYRFRYINVLDCLELRLVFFLFFFFNLAVSGKELTFSSFLIFARCRWKNWNFLFFL